MFCTIVGDVAEIVAESIMSAGGSNARVIKQVFHYRLASVFATPTKAALEAIFQSSIQVPYLAAATSRLTQTQNSVRNITDATDPYTDTARAVAGSIATDGMPLTTSVYYLLKSSMRGRNYNGSKHFAGVNESDTTYDVLTGAGLARWQTLQTALDNTLVDSLLNTWNPCVFSRKLSQISVNPTTVMVADIQKAYLNTNTGTMRKRRVASVRV